MFKIVEMDDGTTKVYDSDTGRIICSVPKKRDKPLGIGRPILRTMTLNEQQDTVRPPSDCHTFNSRQLQSSIQCTVTPLQWESPYNQGLLAEKCSFRAEDDLLLDQDISDEIIPKSDFLQIVQLCPKTSLIDDNWKNLKQELPTRLISRLNPKNKFYAPDLKVSEDVELFSPLGKKWLNETHEGQRRLIDDGTALHYVKKYEAFCKINLASSSSPYSMRCRETKKYVSTYKSIKSRPYFHTYCFNRKQWCERLKVLRTGLTQRGRKLKRLCCKCSVTVSRLSDEEIKKWTARKPVVIDVIDLVSPNEVKKTVMRRSPKISPRYRSSIKNCFVKLENIYKKLVFKANGIFLHGTNIRVNLDDNDMTPISSFHTYARRYNENRPLISVSHSDHAYHRSKPKIQTSILCERVPKNNSGSINNIARKSQPFSMTQMFNGVTKSSSTHGALPSSIKIIPVIDLSSDEDDDVTTIAPSLPVHLTNHDVPALPSSPLSRTNNKDVTIIGTPPFMGFFVFKCHACNHQSTYSVKDQATAAVKEHMFGYHKVANLNMDLKIATDKTKNIFYIDVFNGHKL